MSNNVLNHGKKIAAVVFLMTAVAVSAQAPVPPKGLHPGPGMEKPKPEMLKEITTLTGTVSKMSANDDFVSV